MLTSTAELEVTEATYGLDAGITYGYRTATGLEIADDVSFSGNTLEFTFGASTPGDHIRVLTAAPMSVPEPGSLALLSLGVVGVFAAQRRRRTA